MDVRKNFKLAKRVLIKVGTSVVTQPDGTFALARVGHLVEEIYTLMKEGKQVALVSSGSVGQGRQVLRRQALLSTPLRKHITHHDGDHLPTFNSRVCAAAGQGGMIAFYESLFSQKGLNCSQVLLLEDDFRTKKSLIRETLDNLMAAGIVPIINENDVMSLRSTPLTDTNGAIFWDNDSLASVIAQEIGVDLLLLLTDVPGIYDQDPRNAQAKVIPVFKGIKDIIVGPKSRVGRGGMKSKIDAAVEAADNGVPAVVIASGNDRHTISRIMNGDNVGTLFTTSTMSTDSSDPLEKAKDAKTASHVLQSLSGNQRSQILFEMANQLNQQRRKIIEANDRDLREAKRVNLEAPLLSRLKITNEKIDTIATGIETLAKMTDPVGEVLSKTQVGEGLILTKETVPLGVVLVIFESRPDAIPQLASLAIRSGNGLLLKGGKEASNTNKALHNVLTYAISLATREFPTPLPEEILGLVETREEIEFLLEMQDLISLVIPRGSSSLIRHIQKSSRIPVLGHAAGICHIYVHEDANLDVAERIIKDAKLDYPAACNSVETLLLNKNLFSKPGNGCMKLLDALVLAGIALFAPPGSLSYIPQGQELTQSLSFEYSAPSMTVVIVSDLTSAIEHVNQYGSGHTESIITENTAAADEFLDRVDSACVFHNASTRFADGYRFGLGAEVGISTGKLHARGPVGVEGLLTSKWKLRSTNGKGDIVSEYSKDPSKYLHKRLDRVAKL